MSKKAKLHRHDWDAHVSRERKRNRQLKIALISVLSLAGIAALYLGVVILLEDPPGGPDPGATAAAGKANPDQEAGDNAPGPEGGQDAEGTERTDPAALEPVKPEGAEETVAGGPEGTEVKPAEAPVSPLFKDGVVENGLKAIDLGDERNFLVLLTRYASEVEDDAAREGLKTIYLLMKEGKAAEAFAEMEKHKLPARVRDAVRAVILTRLLKKNEARETFSHADNNSQPAEFNFEYGIYHLGAGNLREAYEQFAAGTRKSPQSAQLQYAAAGAAYDLRRWEDVVKHVDLGAKVTKQAPAKLSLLAAAAEVRMGNPEEALKRCRAVLEEDPAEHNAKLFLARILASQGELDEALKTYGELDENMPDVPLIKVEMVKAYMANDDGATALAVAKKLAESKPDDVRLQAWYADVLAANGKFEEAGKILEGIKDELKGNEMAVLHSIMALRQNDFEAAAKALEPYHTMDPNLAIRWASFKLRQGHTGLDVQQVLEQQQLSAMQWKIVATNAVALSHWDMAAFAYRKSMARGDDTVDTLNNWAWCAIQDPDGFNADEVVAACERALKAAPENSNVLHTYGQALFKSDRAGRCAELFSKYTEATEASAELSLLQGQVYLALGVKPSARQALERALELMNEAPVWNLELTKEKVEEMVAELRD